MSTVDTPIYIGSDLVSSAKAVVPRQDFADRSYDQNLGVDTKQVYIILSTPRSGSTYLASLLQRSGLSLAHEYFHPTVYLPLLANRWNCLHDGKLDKEQYCRHLAIHRTDSRGILGINLHGDHLRTFLLFSHYFSRFTPTIIRLIRRDTIAQAVSLSIALQTGSWSKYFRPTREASYDFDHIRQCAISIHDQNLFNDAYLDFTGSTSLTIYHEDVVADPSEAVRSVFEAVGVPLEGYSKFSSLQLKKQGNDRNRQWMHAFSQDLIHQLRIEVPSSLSQTPQISSSKARRPIRRFYDMMAKLRTRFC